MPRKETKSTRRKPEVTQKAKASIWHVYLLWNSETWRTYIGATTNPDRRLRQHRGELVGGAKSTRRARESWTRVCYLSGFQDRSEAYRWEKLLKMRAYGLQERKDAFRQVAIGICPRHPRKAYSKEYPVPSGILLKVSEESADKVEGIREKVP